ncbi:EAL domain-containing protein [Pseudalkalibacillus decolorationis]|uniref:EAL domain-containing protein n=1 Tax=Pseudalkalibacillus decolorationis TaxID=163879 RepID=UPI00214902A7|nr:EAL domain-containing protein [Pseudalkalibacillus decolorationis]
MDVISITERYISEIQKYITAHLHIPGNEFEGDYFQAGYMVLELNSETPIQSLQDTYQKALAMAKKSRQTNYNQMVHEISEIIRTENISLLSQPIINVEDQTISAMEVLTRGPTNSPYEHPLHLFSMARQTNLLYPLELIVIKKALNQMGETDITFINTSPQTVAHNDFPSDMDYIFSQLSVIGSFAIST